MQAILLSSSTHRIQFDLHLEQLAVSELFLLKTTEIVKDENGDIKNFNPYDGEILKIELPQELTLDLNSLGLIRDIFFDFPSDGFDIEYVMDPKSNTFHNGCSKERADDLAKAADYLMSKHLLFRIFEAVCIFHIESRVCPDEYFIYAIAPILLIQEYQNYFEDDLKGKRFHTNKTTFDRKSDLESVCEKWVESLERTIMTTEKYCSFDERHFSVLFWRLLRFNTIERQKEEWDLSFEYLRDDSNMFTWNKFYLPCSEFTLPYSAYSRDFAFVVKKIPADMVRIGISHHIEYDTCIPIGVITKISNNEFGMSVYYSENGMKKTFSIQFLSEYLKIMAWYVVRPFSAGKQPYKDKAFVEAFSNAIGFEVK